MTRLMPRTSLMMRLETLASIRVLAEPPPVIYVTAAQEGRVAVAALKAGAADYVASRRGTGGDRG